MSSNPYAPPAAERVQRDPGESSAPSKYESERRSVGMLILFAFCSLGIYPAVWYILRARFLDSLSKSGPKLGALAYGPICALVAAFLMLLLRLPPALAQVVNLGLSVATWMAAFRVLGILRHHFAATGRVIPTSGVATFFFGVLYLQYKMNEAAGVPAVRRSGKSKQRKKERKRAIAALAG